MTYKSLIAASLVAASLTFAAAVQAQDAPPAPPTPDMVARYAHSKWTLPTVDDMMAAYPAEAQADRSEGIVKLDCALTASGSLANCIVLSESPHGYNFGKAAVGLFEHHATVDPSTVDGGLIPGDHKIFTYKWSLQV